MKAVWLIDMGYVVKASRGAFRLDYVKGQKTLAKEFGSVATHVFNGVDQSYGIPEGLRRFYDGITARGMSVHLYEMDPGQPGENEQRRVDVAIGAHMVHLAHEGTVATVILTSGDSDLVPAVELVASRIGKPVVLLTYAKAVARDLIAAVKEHRTFEADQAGFELPDWERAQG